MTARLGVAVVGAGRMGRRHAENAAAARDAVLRWVVDPLPETEAFARALGARWCPDLEAVAAADVDAVVVASPTPEHATAVTAALQAGRPVLCEKPLAAGLAATEALAARIAAASAFVQVGFMRRYDAAYAEAHRAVARGEVGLVRHVLAVSRDPEPPPAAYLAASGGIFADLGIHDLDLLRWITGDEVASACAACSAGTPEAVALAGDADEAQALLRFRGGATATLLLSRAALYGYDVRMEVWGAEGSLRVGRLQEPAVVRGDRAGMHARAVGGFLERFGAAYRAEMDDFLARVRAGQPPAVTAGDALAAARAADLCQRALHSGEATRQD